MAGGESDLYCYDIGSAIRVSQGLGLDSFAISQLITIVSIRIKRRQPDDKMHFLFHDHLRESITRRNGYSISNIKWQ